MPLIKEGEKLEEIKTEKQENESKPEIVCVHPEHKEKGLCAQKHNICACELLKDLCSL